MGASGCMAANLLRRAQEGRRVQEGSRGCHGGQGVEGGVRSVGVGPHVMEGGRGVGV